MIMFASEWPTKEIFFGSTPVMSMWQRISFTSRSVIESKSENVSPCTMDQWFTFLNSKFGSFLKGSWNFVLMGQRKIIMNFHFTRSINK